MVVTRRQGVAPMPPVASRTNSSTGSSRSKGKGVDKASPLKDAGAGPSRHTPNGTPSKTPVVGPQVLEDMIFDDDPSYITPKPLPPKPSPPKLKSKNKTKKSSKGKKPRPDKGISIFDILARVFLLWFTIYTLSVCPEDVELQSPVCRALTHYRRLVLEPYVYPPIRAALDHPSIAPHIQRAQPYYNYAVKTTAPLYHRGKYEWRTKVVPQIRWLQLYARPYVRRVGREYDATLGPYVQQASETLKWYQLKAEPYFLQAELKTRQGWIAAKPYVLPVWNKAQLVPGIVVNVVGKPLGEARRQWVDPHVAKIWDAVVEQGKADTAGAKTAAGSTTIKSANITSSPVVHTAASSTTESEFVTIASSSIVPSQSNPEATLDNISFSLPSEPLETLSEPAFEILPPVPQPTDEAAISASSVIHDSLSPPAPSAESSVVPTQTDPEHSPPIPKLTDEAAMSASSVIHDSGSASVPSTEPTGSEPVNSHSTETIFMIEDDDVVEDLDSFLSELEVDRTESEESDSTLSESATPPPIQTYLHREESEEVIRRRAEKRADIEARHTQWEIDLENFGSTQKNVVITVLKTLRNAAAEEVKAPAGPVRTHIENIVQEGEKSLKKLKAYSRKLAAEDKTESEKIAVWNAVVDKVDRKFQEHIDAAAASIREWWDIEISKEVLEIESIASEVNSLADRAQNDLGMDYAWLGDGTTDDWKRYHRLVFRSKEFRDIYLGMQNGTAVDAPPNFVQDVMEALEHEVEELIVGFEVGLDTIKIAAMDVFSGREMETSFVEPTAEAETEPEVSILPIDPSPPIIGDTELPHLILSPDPVEIKEAISRAEEAKTQAHEEL